jgi:probable phosphoglycerate mutase
MAIAEAMNEDDAIHPWHFVSSPLGRARETAAIVANAIGLPVEVDERLCEMGLGPCEGMTRSEIVHTYPHALNGTDDIDWYFSVPTCEGFDALHARAADWLSGFDGQAVIAIAHGLTSRVLRGIHIGLSRADTIRLPDPQDGFYRLSNKTVTFIPA